MPPREDATLTLYTWGTPNGQKPLIMLEELEIPYKLVAVDLGRGDQHDEAYLKINPNGKIPALVDKVTFDNEIRIFESGAILLYLAEKSSRYLPPDGQARADALGWLMFQMGGLGPMLGQVFHFRSREKPEAYALDRYTKEGKRLLTVLERQLGTTDYLAGQYSVADIAAFPWVRELEQFGYAWSDFPRVKAWVDAIAKRPAVERALAIEFGK